MFGNVRELGEGEGDDVGNMNTNAKEVENMVEKLVQQRRGGNSQVAIDNAERNRLQADKGKGKETLETPTEKGKDGDGDVDMS